MFSGEEFIGVAQNSREKAKQALEVLLWNSGWSLMEFSIRTQNIYDYLNECDESGCAVWLEEAMFLAALLVTGIYILVLVPWK